MIMNGRSVKAQEGWAAPNYLTKLGEDLLKSLQVDDPKFIYGISCPCCDNPAYYWYRTRVANSANATFANLFVNCNYQKFYEDFTQLDRDAVFIGNHRASGKPIGNLNILQYYSVSDDCVLFWDTQAEDLLLQIKQDFGGCTDLLYVISAGPLSEVIIHNLYIHNPNNCYIDFGSSIDMYIHEHSTRAYMNRESEYANKECWMHDHNTSFDVSVVMNLYNKPQNIAQQLDAVLQQTLLPKEIILFQDAYEVEHVEIPEQLASKFSDVKVSLYNIGVWGRFEYAYERAKYKYVCVFDDDTIPGYRWLENCHTEMLKQEGLYGTIGIVMKKNTEYPLDQYYRVGWANPFKETVEVDFVGHSWFFKREWLEILLQAPDELKQCKVAGEDMAFSFQLLTQKGIKTFVPPHPKNHFELFGSQPEFGNELGVDSGKLSMDRQNLMVMNRMLHVLIDIGWPTLAKRRPWHVAYLKACLKKGRYRKKRLYRAIMNWLFKR